MFLGILIGMELFGLLVMFSNNNRHKHGAWAILISWAFILIGLCGSIGWIIEVLN